MDDSKRNDLEVKSIAIQWYNLFLKLESKDIKAFPPISSQRLANLGMSGYLTMDYQKTMSLSDAETLALLNKVYSNSLKKYFKHLDSNSFNNIAKLENSISASISIASSSENIIEKASENLINNLPHYFQSGSEHFCDGDKYESATSINEKESKYSFKSNTAILPEWGKNETIVVNKNKVFCPKPYSKNDSFEKSLYAEALEIYSISHNLSKEDIWVAEFWGDDVRGLTFSPAARWISILNQILQKEDVTAVEVLNLYLKMGVGLYDASVICWKSKYDQNLLRPSDFITKNIDSNWQPLHGNPDFPSYPSGHAVFGAVGTRVLEGAFGYSYNMTDISHSQRIEFDGKQRSYVSLKEMANESAYSRMIMGVHYKQDCDEGLRLGYEIGDIINNTDFRSKLIKDNYHL